MTMPITDKTQIEYLLRGCDITKIKEVLQNNFQVDWIR